MDFKKEYEKIIRNRSVVSYLFRIFLYSFLTPLSLSCLQDYRSQLLHLLLCCFRQGRYLVSDAEIGNGGS